MGLAELKIKKKRFFLVKYVIRDVTSSKLGYAINMQNIWPKQLHLHCADNIDNNHSA